MVRIDSTADLPNLNGLPRNSREIELLSRALINLRQRLKTGRDNRAPILNLSLKVEQVPKYEMNPTVSRASLSGDLLSTAMMLPWNTYMTYQIEAWDYILKRLNGSQSDNIIIGAPTAFGKTESAIPPALLHAIRNDSLLLVLSPRRALILDQLNRIGTYDFGSNVLKIGLQFTNIQPKLEWTLYGNQREKKIRGQTVNQNIDYRQHFNYSFENDFVKVKYKDPVSDEAELTFIHCKCGGAYKTDINIRNQRYSTPRGPSAKFLGTNRWMCNLCGKEIKISISREDHPAVKPNIIFTTINSLESLLADPESREDFKNRLQDVILDEVHTYNSVLGAHASAMCRELSNLVQSTNLTFIGLSATIDDPRGFGAKLFGGRIKEFAPHQNDQNTVIGGETYFLMKAENAGDPGDSTYSLKTPDFIQTMILLESSFKLPDQKSLSFVDSIDAVGLLARQTNDAYNTKRLHEFRLTRLLNQQNGFITHMCRGYGQGCHNGCPVFDAGECWEILRVERGVISPNRINALPVSSINLQSNLLLNSSLMISTAELELGVNLPDVTHLTQLGATYTVFNFIQRKGRAGRRPGEKPFYYIILGERANDYLYFSLGTNFLNRQYRLPLESNNQLIVDSHRELQLIYDASAALYYQDTQGISLNENAYIYKFRSTWSTLTSLSEPSFLNFLENEVGLSLSLLGSITTFSDFDTFKNNGRTHVKETIDSYNGQLGQILLDGLTPLQYLERERARFSAEINNSSLSTQDKIMVTQDMETAFAPVLNDLQGLQATDQQRLINQQALLNFINTVTTRYIGSSLSTMAGETYRNIVNLVNIRSLFNAQIRALSTFLILRALFELNACVNATLNSEVVKYFLRAQYFYVLSMGFSFTPQTRLGLLVPPTNLFSSSSSECLLYNHTPTNESKNIDVRDLVYKIFPFRLNESGDGNSKLVNMPEVVRVNSRLMFHTTSTIDGNNFPIANETILFPRSVRVESIRLLDSTNDVVEFCGTCIKFFNRGTRTCTQCHRNLLQVRAYANPIVATDVEFGPDITFPIPGMTLSKKSRVTIILNGTEVLIRNCYLDVDTNQYATGRGGESLHIEADRPYGYSVHTHALGIAVGSTKVNQFLGYFRGNYPSRTNFNEYEVLHSIAHFWVKTISISTGVSPEEFTYEIDVNNSKFIIAEMREGGSGFLSTFLDYLSNSPTRVISDMRTLLSCTVHQRNNSNHNRITVFQVLHNIIGPNQSLSDRDQLVSMIAADLGVSDGEVIENYPTCYDGCYECIGLPSCEVGEDGQLDGLSRDVTQWYFDSIVSGDFIQL